MLGDGSRSRTELERQEDKYEEVEKSRTVPPAVKGNRNGGVIEGHDEGFCGDLFAWFVEREAWRRLKANECGPSERSIADGS